MNTALVYLLVLAAVQSVLTVESGDEFTRIFANEMSPSETYKALEQISSEPKDQEQGADIVELKNVCLTPVDACTVENLKKLDYFEQKYSSYTKNIVPMISHCREQLFEFCNKGFEEQMSDKLGKLSSKSRQAMEQLRALIAGPAQDQSMSNLMTTTPNLQTIEQGIIGFVEAQNPTLARGAAQMVESQFRRELDQMVTGWSLCLDVTRTKPSGEFVAMISDNHNWLQRVKPELLNWMANIKICDEIRSHENIISYRVHQTLSRKHASRGNPIQSFIRGAIENGARPASMLLPEDIRRRAGIHEKFML